MREENLQAFNFKMYEASTKSLKDIEVSAITPFQVDEYRMQLTALYSLLSEELATIDQGYASVWLDIKSEGKTNREVDFLYLTTEDGQRRVILKSRLKSLEKMLSVLKDRMYRLNQEANQEGYKL